MRSVQPLLRHRWPRALEIGCGLGLALLIAADMAISRGARPYLYGTADAIPVNNVGQVLGTSHRARAVAGIRTSITASPRRLNSTAQGWCATCCSAATTAP